PREIRGVKNKFKLYPDEVLSAANFADATLEATFRHSSIHVLARQLNEPEIRGAFTSERSYFAYDWLCDPAGFFFVAESDVGTFEIGDSAPIVNTHVQVRLPVAAKLKLLRNGMPVQEATDSKLDFLVKEPGDYRLEASLTIDGEDRPWIYTNPIKI